MLLHDKRRGGDVAEKHSAGTSKLQHIKQELLVTKHLAKIERQPLQPSSERRAAGSVSRYATSAASRMKPMHSRMMNMPCQPMMSVKNPPATGAATGAIPLMAPIIAIAFARLAPRELVGGDRPRNHDASRRTDALQKPQCHKPMYCGREYTAYG